MIYACIGSEGVGKTTLVNEMRKLGYYATDGISRPCIRAGLHKTMNSLEYQELINELTIHHHYPFTHINQDAFFTRSLLDCIAYGRVHGLSGVGNWEERALEWISKHKDKYIFLYVPIEFELEDDGVRYFDVKHQKEIDKECKKILDETRVNFYVISGSLEERVRKVRDLIHFGDLV